MEQTVSLILAAVGLHLAAGVLFAVPFHLAWAVRMDPGVRGAGLFFRILITPGVIALWPLLARRVLTRSPRPDSELPVSMERVRRLQLAAAQALMVVLPPLFAAALLSRTPEAPPQDLAGLSLVPEPLKNASVEDLGVLFAEPGIAGRLLTAGDRRQLELDVPQDLRQPATALFWSREAEAGSDPEGLVFIGSIHGPARLRFDLPEGSLQGSGSLIIFSLTRSELVASVEWPMAGRK